MEFENKDILSETEIINQYKLGNFNGLYFSGLAYYLPIRVTGTGETIRVDDNNDYIVMDRNKYEFTNNDFLKQCESLPITINHPKDSLLTPETFKDAKIVGNTIYAYVKDSEVWAIAKIFDKDLIENRLGIDLKSTSPGVLSSYDIIVFGAYQEKRGIINHLAFVKAGHWDQTSKIAYQISKGDKQMQDDNKVKHSQEDFNLISEKLDNISSQLDINKKLDEIQAKFESSRVLNTAKVDSESEVKDDELESEVKDDEASETEIVDSEEKETETIDSDSEEAKESVDSKSEEKTDSEESEEVIDEVDIKEKGNGELCDSARTLCDSAPASLGLKMAKFDSDRKPYDNLRRFLKLNKHLVDSKYQGILEARLDSDLHKKLLEDAYADVENKVRSAIESEAKESQKQAKGVFVDSGRGYFVDSSF